MGAPTKEQSREASGDTTTGGGRGAMDCHVPWSLRGQEDHGGGGPAHLRRGVREYQAVAGAHGRHADWKASDNQSRLTAGTQRPKAQPTRLEDEAKRRTDMSSDWDDLAMCVFVAAFVITLPFLCFATIDMSWKTLLGIMTIGGFIRVLCAPLIDLPRKTLGLNTATFSKFAGGAWLAALVSTTLIAIASD